MGRELSQCIPLGSGGIMGRTQRGVDVARARQAWRPMSLLLAVVGALILICAGCGQGPSATIIAAKSSGSGCPTQGVGGDTQPPLCVQQTGGSSSGTNGLNNPESVPNAPAPSVKHPNVGIPGPQTPTSSPGISGPETPTPTPTGLGISGPPTPTTPPPSTPPAPTPQVSAISPTSGTKAGGASVIITGSGFTDATGVDFGSASATMNVDSDTEITATSPPGTGTVDIRVISPDGDSATGPADQFTYVS